MATKKQSSRTISRRSASARLDHATATQAPELRVERRLDVLSRQHPIGGRACNALFESRHDTIVLSKQSEVSASTSRRAPPQAARPEDDYHFARLGRPFDDLPRTLRELGRLPGCLSARAIGSDGLLLIAPAPRFCRTCSPSRAAKRNLGPPGALSNGSVPTLALGRADACPAKGARNVPSLRSALDRRNLLAVPRCRVRWRLYRMGQYVAAEHRRQAARLAPAGKVCLVPALRAPRRGAERSSWLSSCNHSV